MKFRKEKMDSLSGTIVTFTEEGTVTEPATDPFKIVAGHAGIYFMGTSNILYDMTDLSELAKTVDAAWKEHRSLLSAKIQMPGSGH
jgi:hypothetical protein